MHRIVSFLALAATPLAAQFTVAHRGGMARQPQNSMAAFRHAVKTGIDVLEFDLVPARDGKLAVHHDLALHSPLCQSGDYRTLDAMKRTEPRAALGLGMEGLMTDDPDELMRFLAKR